MLIIIFLFSFFFGLGLLKIGIKYLKSKQKNGQPIREDGPVNHFSKAGTPTLGGALFIPIIVCFSLIFTQVSREVLLLLFVLIAYGLIGFLDDIKKISRNNSKGITAMTRLFLEFFIALIAIYFIHKWRGDTTLKIPYTTIDLGLFYYLLASIAIVGSANATNLTDGLDGLLIGSIAIITSAFLIILQNKFQSLVDVQIMLSIVVAIALAFLWYNVYPAKVFMGDTGSLALGGFIGTLALLLGYELFLVVMGGLYVAEALSVILQVAYYKKTRKRIFLMAPLHHHFEKKGLVEPLLVVRLWIVHLLLIVFGVGLSFL